MITLEGLQAKKNTASGTTRKGITLEGLQARKQVTQPIATIPQTTQQDIETARNLMNATNTMSYDDANKQVTIRNKPTQQSTRNARRNLQADKNSNVVGQTIKNIGVGSTSTIANMLEHIQDNNAITSHQDYMTALAQSAEELYGDKNPLEMTRKERMAEKRRLENFDLGERQQQIIEERAQQRYEDTDKVTQALRDIRQQEIEDTAQLPKWQQQIANAGFVVGDMVPTVAAGTLGGPLASNTALFMNAKQNAYNQAIENGATHEQAYWNSMLSAGAELGLETLSGGAFNKLAKVPGVANVSKWTQGIKNPIVRGTANLIGDVVGEGTEEVASTLVQPLIDRITYNPQAPLASIQDVWTSFTDSIIPTLMFGGINAGSTAIQKASIRRSAEQVANKQKAEIDKANIPENEKAQLKKQVDIAKEQTIQQIESNAEKNVTPQSPQTEQMQPTNEVIPQEAQNQNTANMVRNNANMQNNVQNDAKIQQSLGINQENTQVPTEIQTFVETRNKTAPGLKVEMDSTLSTDGVIIKNADGTRTIKINPNSTRKYEFVAVHEMLHDLENTPEFKELSEFVKQRAITHENFEKAKQAITEQYQKYYQENNLDMSGLNMEIETTNDMVAQALGNPQFLNELAGQKPNVFMRLYNWIKNVAFDGRNTGKTFAERNADNKYLQELKKKFETAYNTAYKGGQANQYSIQTRTDGSKYIKVDTDQDIFNGVKRKDYNKVAKMYIEDYLFGNTKLAENDVAVIDETASKKYTHPGKYQSKFEEKMQLTPEIKNVLEIAQKDSESPPTKTDSKYPNWEYYIFDFEIGGKMFTGTINIGIDSKGNKHFYEINKIHPTVQRTSSDKSAEVYSTNSISSQSQSVNNISESSFSIGENQPKTDNKGRELKKGQQERFKKSKARDENGNLVRVYHTTGGYTSIPQFNEFDPRGDGHYKFGNQIVNYYTNSKEMSGSYSDQIYEMADTRKLMNIEDVNNVLDELNSIDASVQFKLNKDKLAVEIYDDQLEIIHEFLMNLRNKDKTVHNDLLNAMMLSKSASDLSDKINANKKLESAFYNDLLHEIDTKTKNKYGYVTATNVFQKLLEYDGLGGAAKSVKFKNENELFRNLKSKLQTEASKYVRRNHWQYEGYTDIQNPYIIDAKNTNWNKIYEGLINEEGEKLQKTLELLENNNLTYTLKRLINNAEYSNKKMNEQLTEYRKKVNDAQEAILNWYARNGNIDELFGQGTLYNERFLEEMKKHLNDKIDGKTLKEIGLEFYNNKYQNYLSNELEKLKKEQPIIKNLSTEELETLANIHFDESELKYKYKKLSQTNDIVKRIIEYNNNLLGDKENKNHTQDEILKAGGYDGVIIKNVYDYGGESDTITPNDLYVTFTSNQFKAVDNENPTDDPDIRYSHSNDEWSKYLSENWDLMKNETQNGFMLPTNEQLQNKQQKEIEEEVDKLNFKKLKLEQIAELTEEDAYLPKGAYKQRADKLTPYRRSFFDNTETSKIISKDVKDRVDVTNYERKHNEDTLEKMKNRLDEDPLKVAQEWWKKDIKKATDQDIALGAILLERYQQEGRFEEAVDVVHKLADIGTEAGRTVQMYSIFQRLTPEGMQIYQQRKLNSAFEEMTKKQTGRWVEQNKDKFQLTEEDAAFITAKVQEAQNAPTERAKQIALAEIESRINEKLPPEAGQSIKAFRRMAMLFNPKTQVRNVVGNTTVMPLNYVTDLVSTAIDKAIAKKTGVRTTTTPNLNVIKEGFKKGWNETWDDYKRGIRTTPTGSKYEIQNTAKSFNENTSSNIKNAINRKLNNMDRLLSAVMEAGDRPFYEAAYQNSLEGQMKANNVTEPTQDMIDVASNVALSQTWQDNNNYTRFVLGVRNAFNIANINGFGLGDLIIPFAKTPANLTKAMVEYSPAGLIPTIINYTDMQRAISRGEMTPMQQKKFVTSVGKAVAGTVLYVIANGLVKGGKITGSSDEDKDVANFEKNVLGIQPYSIKIGDKTYTYNWAQPLAAPLAIMSDTYKMSAEGAKWNEILLNAFKVGGDQLVANSFLQGIQDLFSSQYGDEGFGAKFIDALADLPAQFTPTLFGQIATQFDSTKRQTYENGDTVGTMINEVKNKIPGAKNTLAPQVNTFGEEIENYGGANNPFNVFLNPGNISSANATEAQKELYALYEATQDTTIFPKQAPYSVSGGGEKIKLSSQDRAEYQKTSGTYVSKQLDALFDSEFYKSLENEQKVQMVNKIVTDADNIAKDKWVDTKTTEELNERNQRLEDASIPLIDYYNAWVAQKDVEGIIGPDGKTMSGSKSRIKKQEIDKVTEDLNKYQRRVLYEMFNVGESVW